MRKLNQLLKEYTGIMQLATPIVVAILGYLMMSHGHGQLRQVRSEIAQVSSGVQQIAETMTRHIERPH